MRLKDIRLRRCSSPAAEAEPLRAHHQVLVARFGAAQTTRDAIAAGGRRATGLRLLVVAGELEPHARPVLAVDSPAHGERVDEMQSEAARPAPGGPPADRAVAKV